MLKLLILMILPQIVLAAAWQDLWLNKNQQGSHLLKQNKNSEAAKTFTDKNWKGIAYYRDGKYQEAYNEFKEDNSAQGLYNQGNALAHMQKYQEAIDAYTKSIELQKNSPDAAYNKEVVEKLLREQQQQNNSDQKQTDKNTPEQTQENKQSQNKQKSSQQSNKDKQQNSEQQAKSQDKEQQNSKEQSNAQNQQNNQQQSNSGKQQNNPNQPNNTKQQNSVNQEKKSATKPEQNQQQQANTNKSENSLDSQKTAAQNQAQEKQDADKSTTEQAPTTNYMRPQTPVDIEVKSVLSQIPDDPGGLLRNKFLRDYQNQNQKQDDNNE